MESGGEHLGLPLEVKKILVWHQGALGDVLLAGPALQAIAEHYPGASLTLVGGPEQLGLLGGTLPVEKVLNSQMALWLDLFRGRGAIAANLQDLLAQFDLAVVFTPHRQPEFLQRCHLAGLPQVLWLPSFPVQERMPVGQGQREILQKSGIKPVDFFKLAIPDPERQTRSGPEEQGHGGSPLAALAPGSGHPLKNWPLISYIELARRLREQYLAQVWWVLGPAETGLAAELQRALPGRELRLLKDLPVRQLAATLAGFRLYVGNDSGVTHLAAAVAQPEVIALFGPSEPLIWGPPGSRTSIIQANQACAPCTRGREIRCPDNICMSGISLESVLAVISQAFCG